MKNIFIYFSFFLIFYTFKGYTQGTTCATATPFCTSVGTPFTYVNSTTGSLGTVKCLQTTPGPNWFYVKTTTPGTYVFHLTQSTTPGGTANIDVDFVAFGPYSAPQCTFGSGGGGLTNDCTSIGTPYGEVEDCSYCWDPTETMTLKPTSNCQIYMVLITNYSRTAGYITFTQTSGPATDCNITNVAWTPPASMCVDAASINLNLLINGGSTGGTWSGPGVSGTTFNPATAGTGTHTITYTVSSGICPSSVSHTITVTSGPAPTFTALGPYCIGATAGSLPGTSTNSITGTWSPAAISTATPGTTVYTFTPNAGQCAPTTTMSVVVNSSVTPTFSALGPFCVGASPTTLPGTSTNGIAGTWNPTTISTATAGTSVYTFTPSVSCATTTTMSITVTTVIIPNFAAIPAFCSGSSAPILAATSPNGISGTWSPSTINNTTSGTYTFTPNTGQCSQIQTLNVTVTPQAIPNFAAIPAFCSGSVAPILGATSPNGISGTWFPSTINNTTSGIYIFTPNTGQCAANQILNVVVNSGTTPTFSALGPYCVGATPGSLPGTSTNSITGNWSPAAISTATSGSTVYTFTPNAGQCATATNMSVTVNSTITPTFSAFGPYCVGATPGSLPLTSSNSILGTWSPNTISTATLGTTTYTFTPNTGQCAIITTMNVTVTSSVTPTFNALGPYCVGSSPGILPGTSLNSIAGTWSPANISTSTLGTTVYSFTPTSSLCATNTTMSITVSSQIIPDFAAIPAICAGSTAPVLGTTSPNGITGSWSPSAISNQTSGSYTFTPDPGQCATNQTLNVTINIPTVPNFAAIPPFCTGSVSPVLALTSPNGITGTWTPAIIDNMTGGPCTFTPNIGQCATVQTLIINLLPAITPNFTQIPLFCSGSVAPLLGTTSPNGINGTWAPAIINNTTSGTYTFTPDAGQCALNQTLSVNVPAPIILSVSPPWDSICQGSSVPLVASGAVSYTWSPSGSLSNSTGSQVIATPSSTTTYTVSGTNNLGCNGFTTVTIFVDPNPPFIFSMLPSEGCEPLLVTFIFDINNTLIDQNSLHYNFGDPNSSSNISTDATTSHLYNESGFYIVTLTANSVYGCPVSYTDTVRVYKTPIADFITHPDAPDMNNPLINFYDQSYLASTWNWTFGDLSSNGNNYSDNQNPTHTYPDTGNYQITLIVSNSNSCYDTVIHIIRILPTFEFWIPNAFTPGGDGRNETFYGKGLGFKNDNFEMFVYDRWGKLIFSKTGYDEFGWDGTFMNSGKICEQGGYTYLIKLTEIGGLNHVYKGITFLIR